jgi:hypothetical protein
VQDGGHGLLGEKRVPFLVRSAEAIVPF